MEDRDTFILLILVLIAGLILGLAIGRDVANYNAETIACEQVATLTDMTTEYDGNMCNIKVNDMWVSLDSYIDFLNETK